ncbi:hypothetical protein HDU77_010624 [Chytriomyces hyalinus]|nr:hypothetical protein HDU77_010624 [Chytriomyces hyalinus]
MDDLKTLASQIEAQEAVVEEREAALLDAIKRNDKAALVLQTVYQNAVVRLNRLMDEKKDLKALLAQKEPSTVAKDIAELKQKLAVLMENQAETKVIQTQMMENQAETSKTLQLINKKLNLRVDTQTKAGREPSSNGAHEGDESSRGPSSGSVDGGAQPASGSSGSGSGRRLSNDTATSSSSDFPEHDTGSDAWQVSSSGVDERLDSGAEI